jgi:hypothetical protein
MLLHRPYCGNPFIAPGVIGSKTKRIFFPGMQSVGLAVAPDEGALFFDEEETQMPKA